MKPAKPKLSFAWPWVGSRRLCRACGCLTMTGHRTSRSLWGPVEKKIGMQNMLFPEKKIPSPCFRAFWDRPEATMLEFRVGVGEAMAQQESLPRDVLLCVMRVSPRKWRNVVGKTAGSLWLQWTRARRPVSHNQRHVLLREHRGGINLIPIQHAMKLCSLLSAQGGHRVLRNKGPGFRGGHGRTTGHKLVGHNISGKAGREEA